MDTLELYAKNLHQRMHGMQYRYTKFASNSSVLNSTDHYNIAYFQATLMFLAPNQAIAMLKEGKYDHIDPSSLKEFIIGGAPISSENLKAIRELLPDTNVFSAFGQTEIAGIGTVFRKSESDYLALLEKKPKSCGKPIPGIWYKVLEDLFNCFQK